MGLWALITATFLIQEFATTALVLVVAQRSDIPLWPIHIIWAATTLADMYVGYLLGQLLKHKLNKNKFVQRIDGWVHKADESLGKYGTNLALMLLGIIDFPYINTFIGAWLDVPMNMAFLFTFIGNFIWYLLLWGTVLGLTSFISNPSIILFIIIAIGVFSQVGFQIVNRTKRARRRRS
jgi:membrane protein YqaA with SNARE-associated domain